MATESPNVYDHGTTEVYTETFPVNPSRQMMTDYVYGFVGRHGLHGSLVDFGCGTGEDGALFNETGVAYYGNDLSREMLDYGRTMGATNTVVSDLAELPYADDTFDAGMSLWALQYKEDLNQTLTEWRRVLVDGAPLLVVVPHPVYKFAKYSHDYFVSGPQWEQGLGITRFNYYHSFGNYVNALVGSGFVIETIHEPQRQESAKEYFGIPKANIPHDLIIEARTEK